jgi:hypothetical protein
MEPKLKVFISSAQYNDEFNTEREGLPTIFLKQPLCSSFYLWRIEDYASPDSPESHYLKHINDSDILILLLGKTFREAVGKEFQAAITKPIPVFTFEKKVTVRDAAMDKFIERVKPLSTYTSYSIFSELVEKIENSILQYYFRGAKQNNITEWREHHLRRKHSPEERALRLLVGILASDTASITKYKVIKSLIFEASLLVSNPTSSITIVNNAIDIVRLNPNVHRKEFSEVLDLLLKNGEMQKVDDDKIELEQKVKVKYILQRKTQEKEDNRLLTILYTSRNDSLKSVSFDTFTRILTNVITQVVYDTAVNMAEQEFCIGANPFAYNADEINRVVSDVLINITDLPNGGISEWQPVIVSVLQSNDTNVITWLNRLRKAYWSLTVLGMDPSVVECANKNLSNYCIYLDSHIVLRAIVEAGGESTMCRQILQLSKNIGIEMRISQSLFLEIDQAFYSADKAYYASGMDIPRAIKFFNNINRKSDIFDGYIAAKSRIHDLSWENFLNRFYSPSNKNKLERYLYNELGITVQPEEYFSTDQLGRIENIVQRLLFVRRQMVHPPENLEYKLRSEWERQYLLRTNEARQMAIIFELRRENPDNDKQYWFVTFDQFVYEVNTALVTSENDDIYRYPCYMKPAIWLEIIVNASPNPLPINTFREILLSRDIQQVADQIETEVINQMLKSRVDQNIENIETLRNMFSDLVNRPAVQQAYKDVLKAEGIEKLSASDKFKDSIIIEMKDKLIYLQQEIETKLKEVVIERKRVEKAEGKAKYFKRQVGRLTSDKKRKNHSTYNKKRKK